MVKIGDRCTVYRQRIIVEGSGSFPFDMLRYDSCSPSKEEEIHKLTMGFRDMPEYHEPRQVELVRYSLNGEWPTVARWKSFGWRVIQVDPLL